MYFLKVLRASLSFLYESHPRRREGGGGELRAYDYYSLFTVVPERVRTQRVTELFDNTGRLCNKTSEFWDNNIC